MNRFFMWNRKVIQWSLLALVCVSFAGLIGCNCGKVPSLPEKPSIDGGFEMTLPDAPGPGPVENPSIPDSVVEDTAPPPCKPKGSSCQNDTGCNPSCSGVTQVCFEGSCQSETPPPPDEPPVDQKCPSQCASHDDCRVPACGNRTQCVNGACSYIPPTCPGRCRTNKDCQTPDCGKRIQCVQRSCTAPPECPGACFQDSDCNVVACGPRKTCENSKCVEPRKNTAPVADAGTDLKGAVNQRVILNGSNSRDAEGDKLTYSWRFVSKPNGSLTALDDTTSATPAFVPDKAGNYALELVVHDGRESSKPDTVVVHVARDATQQPQLASIAPSQVEEGYTLTPLAAFGKNFARGATIHFNGKSIATQYINTANLVAQLPTGLKAGSYSVSVKSPSGGTSKVLTFTVFPPKPKAAPVLTRISPVEFDAGTPFKLEVFGRSFDRAARIVFNGVAQTSTQFVNAGQLTVNISGKSAGTYKVSVRNGTGLVSAVLTLQIKTVKVGPILHMLTPTFIYIGKAAQVTLSGDRFTATSIVFINGKTHPATFSSSKQLVIPALTLSQAGHYSIWVENSNGQKSNQLPLEVRPALMPPAIKLLSPAQVVEKTVVSIGIIGKYFEPKAKVSFQGNTTLPTTFVSSGELRITLPNTVAKGQYAIRVINPDGQTSGPAQLTVVAAAPKPVLTRVNPVRVPLGSTGAIQAIGSQFIQGAQVQVGTRLLKTKFVSSTQLTFALPKNFQVGTYLVRVFNAKQASNTVKLEVYKGPAPDLTALAPDRGTAGSVLTLRLLGKNFVSGAVALFQGGVQPTTFVHAGELQMTLSLSSLAPGGYDVWVRNPDGQNSIKLKFTVDPPKGPQIKQLLPNTGQSNTKVNGIVDGVGFKNGAQVKLGGKTYKATFLSTSTLGVTFDLTGLGAGTFPVTVTNPGGATSNIVYFTVKANQLPAPILTTVTPATISLGANKPVYLLGKHFQNGALMMLQLPFVGAIGMPTNFINSTTLVVTAQFPRIPFPFPAQRTNVYVRNPGTTNRDSNKKPVTVRP